MLHTVATVHDLPLGLLGSPASPEPYQKPRAICVEAAAPAGNTERDTARYTAVRRRKIERDVARLGVRLQQPGVEHLNAILRFSASFGTPLLRALNSYEVFRVLRFGRPLVLLGPDGEILGYDLAFDSADEGGERTLGTCGYAVSPALAGHNLGAMMVTYSALRAMAAGATLRRGIVGPCNVKSLATLLNHFGAVCDGFFPEFGNWGEPRFSHVCRLSPAGLSGNRIDLCQTEAFLAAGRPGRDYVIVDGADSAALDRLYRETAFRVVAVLPRGGTGGGPGLLAVPLPCAA
jgi:hypothetical protein